MIGPAKIDMSTGYGRLCEARDKAQPIAPETVEVLAIDLDEQLQDYRKLVTKWMAAKDTIDRLRCLIAAHVNASNNDDSAGDTFAALVAEVAPCYRKAARSTSRAR